MTSARELTIVSSAQAPAPREKITRVEKLNPSNTLQRKHESQHSDSLESARARARWGSSRFETEESAPLWNGPRLRPAFVAQVLGQVFAATERRESSLPTAYRTAAVPSGLLFDAKA
jgi:hypothetical protein